MRVFQIEGDWGIDNLRQTERLEPVAGRGQVVVSMRMASLNARDLIVPERGYGRATGNLPLIAYHCVWRSEPPLATYQNDWNIPARSCRSLPSPMQSKR
jgi:hypothetical protein